MLAVDGVGGERWRKEPPRGAQLVEHLRRQLPLRSVTLLLRQVQLGAPQRILVYETAGRKALQVNRQLDAS